MSDPLNDLGRLEGVPSAVVAARDAVDAVLRDRGMRQVSAETSATALLAGAKASAALETAADDVDWLPNAVRLQTELIELSAMIRSAPGQALARAHAVLMRGLVPDEELGRVRDQPEIAERLVGLNQLLAGETSASAVVAAAIAHAEILAVAPFGMGDGIIARAVEHMILIQGGVDPRAAVVPEAGHLAAGPAYRQALVGYQSGSTAGVRGWIIHCSQALAYGAEKSPLNVR